MRNKIFTKIIITTLLVTFLTFNVGRVTRVSAVGTTAAIAGTAFILTGAVYLSYVALTQGEMVLPAAEELHSWLGGIGRKVSQYPSGAVAYQDIYQQLVRSPAHNFIDGVWTWTQERIKSFANDFSNTDIISNILAYQEAIDISYEAWNGFSYAWDFEPVSDNFYMDGSYYTSASLIAAGAQINVPDTPLTIYEDSGHYTLVPTSFNTVRNVLKTNGKYGVQVLNNGVWENFTGAYNFGIYVYRWGRNFATLPEWLNNQLMWHAYDTRSYARYAGETTYPLFPQESIYSEEEDRNLPMVIPADTTTHLPSWTDPDNNNRPIIPWVPIPHLPTGIPTPPGYTGTPQWGFPLQDLLDLLEELARTLMDIGAIGELINQFAGQHGDNYYLEYNDGDTNYYTIYQPTIYDNDTQYITYRIDVSEEEDVLPVDLNTISLYTQNRYLDQIKQSAIAGSSMLRDLAVFWYDVDPEVTYIVLGCCILVLIGAFTGKLGHS